MYVCMYVFSVTPVKCLSPYVRDAHVCNKVTKSERGRIHNSFLTVKIVLIKNCSRHQFISLSRFLRFLRVKI